MVLTYYPDDNYGDNDWYMSPRQYEMLRRQEELKRRNAAELQRRRQEELYRSRLVYERELARRLEEEEAIRRQLEDEERLRKLRIAEQQRQRGRGQKYGYRIVRGLDGRLYRVPVQIDDDEEKQELTKRNQVKKRPEKDKSQPSTARLVSLSGRSEEGSEESSDFRGEEKATLKDQKAENKLNTSLRASPGDEIQVKVKPAKKKAAGRRCVTIVVEDASDSENEHEINSVWRNRRPSPGQWMEPVEAPVL